MFGAVSKKRFKTWITINVHVTSKNMPITGVNNIIHGITRTTTIYYITNITHRETIEKFIIFAETTANKNVELGTLLVDKDVSPYLEPENLHFCRKEAADQPDVT